MKRVTAVLVLLLGLACVYLFVPKEEQAAPGSGVLAEKPVSEAAPSHDSPSPKRQAPAQLADTSGPISIRTHEQSVPASEPVPTPTSAVSAPAPALIPVTARATGALERGSASAQAAKVEEEIPLQWAITGSNAEGYELRADRAVVLSKSASAVLESRADTDTSRFGALVQVASATPFRGKRIELSGYIASVDASAGASIWLRADDVTAATVAFDNSAVRGIRGTTEWTYQNIVIDVPNQAVALLYGAVLNGRGKLYVDDFQFRVVDESVAVTAKRLTPPRSVARGRISDPGQGPRNLDFEETAVRTDAFSQ